MLGKLSDHLSQKFSHNVLTPRRVLTFSFLLLSFVSSTGFVGAEEWSRFRGPNGSGLSDATTVPVTWTEADFNWRVKLPGKGHSSPVVRWSYNLLSANYTAPGDYTIKLVSGDDSEYSIDPTCTALFVVQE